MASTEPRLAKNPSRKAGPRAVVEDRDELVVRFAGDAGDGMQLVGDLFTLACTRLGNHVFTVSDPPAEIRAPAGTLAGVCGSQVHVSRQRNGAPGDAPHILLAMNPAALRANLSDLPSGATVIVNADAFLPEECEKAGYSANPLTDGTLSGFRVAGIAMNRLNREAVARVKVSPREAERCKNFFALGLVACYCDRPIEPMVAWIHDTYIKNPGMIEASTRTLKAGYHCAETCPDLPRRLRVPKVDAAAGRYRQINGTDALALGILAAARQSKLPLVFAGFPMRPANELLHRLCEWKQANVKVIQAEDDLAAVNLALGASFGGALGVTATTGPGLALQSETLGLAVISELPCVVIDVQRAGPSLGMPSKSEQADLLQALHGRNGESPLIVVAPDGPADGFATVLEAARLAIRFMTPVIVLADAQLAKSAETWRVPTLDELPAVNVEHAHAHHGATTFLPYQRDANLARPWAIPGTAGLEHRTGGLEKEELTGNVSYDARNHEQMVEQRAKKIAAVAGTLPPLEVHGPARGDLLILGWGSTRGAIRAAVERCQSRGLSVASAHVRHLHPLPANVGEVMRRYRKVLVPELNAGQLCSVLRSTFLVDAISLSKVQGQPYLVSEIEQKIIELT